MNTVLVSVRHFAHEHDDQPAFHATYLVLAFITALLFNLGAFGLLIIAHMSLDLVKYRERHGLSWVRTFEGMIRESLTDITLLTLGVAMSVYLQHSVAIASVSAMFRVPEGIIDPLILAVPKFEILKHFVYLMTHLKRYLASLIPGMFLKWTATDHICFALCGASLASILIASPLLHVPAAAVLRTLAGELIPWRM